MSVFYRKTALFLALFVAFVFICQPLFGQSGAGGSDPLVIKLAVIGPGDELYFWWGHIGLIIEDTRTGRARFYDWGIFSFEKENFFYDFAIGRLVYTCGGSNPEWNLGHYMNTNREITIYTLDLPPEKKEEVRRYAEWSVLPENKDYFYHHFDDNCATRIRDIIDMALDGEFKDFYSSMRSRFTLREHVHRHTWFNIFIDWTLSFLMGQGIDEPLTVWDDMFLPAEIGMRVSEYTYINKDGKETHLVSSVEVMNRAVDRPVILDYPRSGASRELIASVVLSLVVCIAFVCFGGRKGFYVVSGLIQSLLGLFFGLLGCLLCFMTFFTNHDYTYFNSNFLIINPLFLAVFPLGLIFAFTKKRERRGRCAWLLMTAWIYVFFAGLLTMVIKFSPVFYQQNQIVQALLLPFAFFMIVLMAASARSNR